VKQRQPKFHVFLTEAVHEGLSSISPSIPSVVFFYLKKDGSIQSDYLIDDLEAFEGGLKKIFGFGAKVIEKKILEALYIKLQVTRDIKDDFEFVEEVKSAQRLLGSIDLVTKKNR
jgi:hypothetical protein